MNAKRSNMNSHSTLRFLSAVVLVIVLLLSLLAAGSSEATPGLDGAGKAVAPADVANVALPVTVVFRRWVSPDPSYAGVADTYISLNEPNTNYATSSTMKLHTQGQRERVLVKFDISRIPTTARVLQATLTLFVWYRNQTYRATVYAYKVRRHWTESDATWNGATATTFWSAAGCNDPVYDYDPTVVATTTLNYTNQTYSWDVTSMVQQWVASPISNEGVVLIGEGLNVEYQFRSSDIPAPEQRPSLSVTYEVGPVSPTPTHTFTPTRSPTATQSPTNTPTHTPSPTFTQTPIPSATPTHSPTPLYSPTPTTSPTPTLSPTPTPTHTPVPPPVTQEFRQGVAPVAAYAGVTDTFLSSYRPDTPWGEEDGFRVSNRPSGSERALLRFDLQGYIPANARVTSARLAIFAWSRRTLNGMRISAFDVIRTWDGSVATWNRANPTEMWTIPGCNGVDTDRQGDPVDSRFVYFTNQFYEWDVTALVQRWVANLLTNQGLLLIGYDVDQDVRFRSSEWRVPEQRPKLTVTYQLP